MPTLYLSRVPYWLFSGVIGIATGFVVFAGVTYATGAETVAYLSAFVAMKLVLDEAKAVLERRL